MQSSQFSKTSEIEFSPFLPEDQEGARTLILEGLGEHWGFIDPTLNPDLDNIAETYKDDLFLVARLRPKIIGTGALLYQGGGIGRIVRMSVDRDLRRVGLGTRILGMLIHKADRRGYHKLVLETTDTWTQVIAFYRACGFRITHHIAGNIHFVIDLHNK